MDDQRLQEIENSIGRIDCPECEGGVFCCEDDGLPETCEACDGNGTISRFAPGHELIAELRRLRQERDAALAEARLQAQQNTSLREDCDFHIRQRDAALAERDGLRELLNVYNIGGWTDALAPMQRALKAEAALTEARRVLREVEWTADNGYDAEDACPLCRQPHSMGHATSCALAAVLAQEEPS